MLKVYICDDDPSDSCALKSEVKEIARRNSLSLHITNFHSGKELLFYLSEKPAEADIIFLDVVMPGMSGIETARHLRSYGCRAEIIFNSSFHKYVFQSFETSPVNYLVKGKTPPAKIESTFIKAVSRLEYRSGNYLVCESGSSYKLLMLDEIAYFEIMKRVIIVHYGNGDTFKYYSTMEKLSKAMEGKGFLRVHRSFLVNMEYIVLLNLKAVILRDKTELPVGITYAKDVKQSFSEYVEGSVNRILL